MHVKMINLLLVLIAREFEGPGTLSSIPEVEFYRL